MSEPMLKVEGLAKRFGGIVATDNLSLDVAPGELHAIIGPNGAGKTTLIAQLSGQLRADFGRIRFAGDDITALPPHKRSLLGLARSFQIPSTRTCRTWSSSRSLQRRRLSKPTRSPRCSPACATMSTRRSCSVGTA